MSTVGAVAISNGVRVGVATSGDRRSESVNGEGLGMRGDIAFPASGGTRALARVSEHASCRPDDEPREAGEVEGVGVAKSAPARNVQPAKSTRPR